MKHVCLKSVPRLGELLSYNYRLQIEFSRSPITNSVGALIDHANFIELLSYSHLSKRTAMCQISHASWMSLDGNVRAEKKLFFKDRELHASEGDIRRQ